MVFRGHTQYATNLNVSRVNDVDDRNAMSSVQWTTNSGGGRGGVILNSTGSASFTDQLYNSNPNASSHSSSALHRNAHNSNAWMMMMTQSSNPSQLHHNASNNAMPATNSYAPNQWRSSQYHSGAEWPSNSSGGYGSSHSTAAHSSYGKPYEKPYSKYDSYSTNKYSSRRY